MPPTLTERVRKEEQAAATVAPVVIRETTSDGITEDDLARALQQLSSRDKKAFYNLIVKATKNLPNYSSDDILLINTALYLKGGANWKETVREYWKKD